MRELDGRVGMEVTKEREREKVDILIEGAIVGLERTAKNPQAPTRTLKKEPTRGAQLGLQTIVQRAPKLVILIVRTGQNWMLEFRM